MIFLNERVFIAIYAFARILDSRQSFLLVLLRQTWPSNGRCRLLGCTFLGC